MAEESITAPPVVEVAPVATPEDITPAVEAVVEVAPVVEKSTGSASEASPKADAPKPLLSTEEVNADQSGDVSESVQEPLKTEDAPVEIPTYEFKIPEGSNADSPIFKSFQAKLGEFQNLSNTEKAAAQKFGQEMLDMHLDSLKEFAETNNKASWDWFNNRNKEWLESAKKDPSIGGDNWDGTVSDATKAVSLYGGTKAQQMEVAKLLQDTGVENHPAMLRLLSNITKVAAKEGSPVTSQSTPMTRKQGIAEAMYGTK